PAAFGSNAHRKTAAITPTVAAPERSTTEIRRAGSKACVVSFAAQQFLHALHLADSAGRAFTQVSQQARLADGSAGGEHGASRGVGAAGAPDAGRAQGSARREDRHLGDGAATRIGGRRGCGARPGGGVPLAEAVVDRPDGATAARGRGS